MRLGLSGAILVTCALAGCAESQTAGSLFYLTPYKFEDLTCDELRAKEAASAVRVRDLEDVRSKATRDTGGGVINTVVHSPDYQRARWERRLYQDEAARKNCYLDQPMAAPK